MWLCLNHFLKDAVLFHWRQERAHEHSTGTTCAGRVQVQPLWLLEYAIQLMERENDNSTADMMAEG